MDASGLLIPLVVACAVSALMTPLAWRVAERFGVVDRPSERSVAHRARIPLLGGLAVAGGFGAGLATALWWLRPVVTSGHLSGLLLGGAIILVLGVWDDRFGLGAGAKFTGQTLAALVAISSGFEMGHLTDPLTRTTFFFPPALAWIASVVWIVGITNALNLIDGLDGLATGVGAIICATLTVIVAQAGNMEMNNHFVSHVRLREAAFDSIPVAQIVLDLNSNVSLINQEARTIFDLHPQDAGLPFQDLDLSYRPVELRSRSEQVYTDLRPQHLTNIERTLPDGKTQCLDIYLVPLLDTDGTLLGISIAFHDVTHHRRLQIEL